jgi:nitrogen fixation NifU-like protein|tara:strand:- start:256 stop:621 length:366 start_codon:yes stop_codon:yes gene_type:complete
MINPQIIKFATDTSNYGIKKNSNFIATSKNKICGDKITVEVEITKKIIKKMNYETDSCIFCQASASLLSKSIKNKNKNSILSFLSGLVRNKEFKKLLKNKERINCVMLPLQTLQKAIDKAK